MRKIFASVIAIALILTSFSVVAFAADTNVYFGDGSGAIIADSDSVTLTLYLDKDDEDISQYGIGNLEFSYDVADATVVPTPNSALASSFTLAFGIDTKDKKLVYTAAESYIPSKVTELATFVVTRVGDVATSKIKLGDVNLTDSTGYAYTATSKGITITWPSSKPVVSDKAMSYDKDTFGKYTDVPCFNGSAKITGTYTGVKLGFDLYNGETFNKTVEPVSIVAGKTMTVIEDGTIKFKVAVIGVPAGTDVQIKNIVVNAE